MFLQITANLLILVYFSLLVVYKTTTSACGIVTHTEIGHRALEHFVGNSEDNISYPNLLRQHQDAFQAGNPYPDAFYDSICWKGMYHDISEDTHWAPFLNASINYIRQQYPQPWDQETQKLVAFVFGFASHQIADVTWHSLGIDQGFLSAMGYLDFHGSFNDAHNAGDIGGDIVNAFELDLSYISSLGDWYVPSEDLYNIYNLYYGREGLMPRHVIEECSALLFLGRLGEKLAINKLFLEYASRSPFLVDELSSYFLGGLDDMAVWSQYLWQQTAYMLQHGTQVCSIPHSPLGISCHSLPTRAPLLGVDPRWVGRAARYIAPRRNGLSLSDVIVKRTRRGARLTAGPRLQSLLRASVKQYDFASHRQGAAPAWSPPTQVYNTDTPLSRLGWAMITGDQNNDGFDDLIIGAPMAGDAGNPQRGKTYVIWGSAAGLPLSEKLVLERDADVVFEGPDLNGKFGFSLALVDLNADGLNDIAVGAPSSGSRSLAYQGNVYVFYGTHKGNKLQRDADLQLTCDEEFRYCGLGWSLAGGDVNGDGFADLILGSPWAQTGQPQQGSAWVKLASSGLTGISRLSSKYFDWNFFGEQPYSWYGYTVGYMRTAQGPRILVGAPGHRLAKDASQFNSADVQSAGKLYMYRYDHSGNAILTINGTRQFQKLGAAFSQQRGLADTLAVARIGADSAGSIAGVSVQWKQSGDVLLYNVTNAQPISSELCGDRRYSRFGASLSFADVDGDAHPDFIVSAPRRTEDFSELLYGAEEGLVYVYSGGRWPTADCGLHLISPCPGEQAAMILALREQRAQFGHNVVVASYHNQSVIAVSAPNSNRGARLGGAVGLFIVPHAQ